MVSVWFAVVMLWVFMVVYLVDCSGLVIDVGSFCFCCLVIHSLCLVIVCL